MVMPTMARERDTTDQARKGDLGTGARALNYGASALLTGVIMVGASLLLWIGVPAGWLWIGSQVQGSTGSIGTAIYRGDIARAALDGVPSESRHAAQDTLGGAVAAGTARRAWVVSCRLNLPGAIPSRMGP